MRSRYEPEGSGEPIPRATVRKVFFSLPASPRADPSRALRLPLPPPSPALVILEPAQVRVERQDAAAEGAPARELVRGRVRRAVEVPPNRFGAVGSAARPVGAVSEPNADAATRRPTERAHDANGSDAESYASLTALNG